MNDVLREKVWREREAAEAERLSDRRSLTHNSYCRYCVWLMNADVHRCRNKPIVEITYYERYNTYAKCEDRNKNNDCPDYRLGVNDYNRTTATEDTER